MPTRMVPGMRMRFLALHMLASVSAYAQQAAAAADECGRMPAWSDKQNVNKYEFDNVVHIYPDPKDTRCG